MEKGETALISRVGPLLRMCLRVVAFSGLLGFASGVVETIVDGHSLLNSLGIGVKGMGAAQSSAFLNMLFFGIIYSVVALTVSLFFDYEPNPRRFKNVMALVMLPLPLLLLAHGVGEALRYPSLYDASDLLHLTAYVLGFLWLSQYISGKYLRELAAGNPGEKRV